MCQLLNMFLASFFTFTTASANVISSCISQNDFALTFDDGPTIYTESILDILAQKSVKATFFVNGLNVFHNKSLAASVKRMYAEGHSIGTHTFSHGSLTKLNDFNVRRELSDNELFFRSLFQKRPLLFRPPYFDYDDRILNIVEDFGYQTIITNLDSQDWLTENSTLIYNAFLNAVRTNNNTSFISLQHETIIQTVQILPQIIDFLSNNSYNLVNMKDCVQSNNDWQADNVYGPFLDNSIVHTPDSVL